MKLAVLFEDVIDFAAKKAERDKRQQNWYAVVWKMLEETAAPDPGMDDVGMSGPTTAPVGNYVLNNPGNYLHNAVDRDAQIVVARTQHEAVQRLEYATEDWIEGNTDEIYYPDYYKTEANKFGTTFKAWTEK